MDSPPKKEGSRAGKILKLLLKLLVSAACLWYVSGKIDWNEVLDKLVLANPGWILLAALCFVLSKIFSSIRLRIYFQDINVPISERENLRLYWLGMFYNLLLPGAISGDAYKVLLLKQWYQTPYKKSGAAVLLDRISGMLGLGLLLALFGWMVLPEPWQSLLITLGSFAAVLALYLVVNRWMRDYRNSFFITLLWGLAVQGMQVLSAYCIMAAFDIPLGLPGYIFLFLLSSVAAVLPLSVGGLGIREIVFLHGAAYLGLQQSHAVLVSLIFYLITVFCSIPGVWFIWRFPVKKRAA